MTTSTRIKTGLKETLEIFQRKNPTVRIRDAARQLGVSEGELLASSVGDTATRLNCNFKELLHELHKLGHVMALTRNDRIIHERKGVYQNAQTNMPHKMALFVNPDIDLRIFLANWHHAFAAEVENPRGTLKSIQIFDVDGTAIHKIYLTDRSNAEAYNSLVEKFKAEDQTPLMAVSPKPEAPKDRPDSQIDVENMRKAWANLRDTHDFFPLLSNFGVGREQALRLADPEMVRQVPVESFKFILTQAARRELPIMVFVGNDGIIQIHTGEVQNVAEARGWYNVMDEDFNLHIDQDAIASAYVVKKPTVDGIVTSLELFDVKGKNVALFFGKRKPGIPEKEEWRKLVSDLLKQNL